MLRWLSGLLRRGPREAGLGSIGEEAAASYLRRQGLEIVGKNVRAGRGEIDLVARQGSTLVFVEVKSRSSREPGEFTGLENIDRRKRSALRRACSLYRQRLPEPVESYRLDVVIVEFGGEREVRELHWYPAVLDLDVT